MCLEGKRNTAVRIGYKRDTEDSYITLYNNDGKSNFYGSHTLVMWLYIEPLERPAYLLDQAAK